MHVLDRVGQPLGVGDGERVDDARAGQRRQVVDHPGEPLDRGQPVDHRQLQAGPGQRPAQHERVDVAELGGHVVGDPRVRRRGRGQHRGVRVESPQHVGHPAVVGPEVVAPVGDGVRLVDHQQAEVWPASRSSTRRPKPGLASRSGDTSSTSRSPSASSASIADHSSTFEEFERRRAQPGPLRRRDLVAHEREQRRHDERRPGALGPADRGGRPVDRRLAPPGRWTTSTRGPIPPAPPAPSAPSASSDCRCRPARRQRSAGPRAAWRPARPAPRSPAARRPPRSGSVPGRRPSRWRSCPHARAPRGHLRRPASGCAQLPSPRVLATHATPGLRRCPLVGQLDRREMDQGALGPPPAPVSCGRRRRWRRPCPRPDGVWLRSSC